MIEVLGAAASVATIIGLAKTCIALCEKVSDARHASEDLDRLLAQFRIERLKFFVWCQIVGFTHCISMLDQASSKKKIDDGTLINALSPNIRGDYVLGAIEAILKSFQKVFEDSDKLLQAYTTISPQSFLSRARAWVHPEQQSSALVQYVYSDTGRNSASTPKPMGMLASGKWAMKDKKQFKDLIAWLEKYNDGLLKILDMTQNLYFNRQIELLTTNTTPMRRNVLEAHSQRDREFERQSSPASRDRDMLGLVLLSQRADLLDTPAVDTQRVGEPANTLSQYPDGHNRELPSFEFQMSGDERLSRNRICTLRGSQPVVIEWKYYSTRLEEKFLQSLRRRVDLLSLQLHQSSSVTGFSILDCLGHFEDKNEHRVAIVFSYPENRYHARPISLKDLLAQDQDAKTVRDQDERVRVALKLVLTFYRLHSVGWLHKSFRSENILFFNDADQDPHLLTQPYLCGFDFSRQDSPHEMTENVPSVLLHEYADFERSLYRHPDLDYRELEQPTEKTTEAKQLAIANAEQAAKEFRYQRAYDIYSLGIVLLEIGHWCPAKHIGRTHHDLKSFRDKMHDNFLPQLRYRMPKKYYDVTQRCLNGDFHLGAAAARAGSDVESQTPKFENNLEVEALRERREWLETFERYAVRELESIAT